MPVTLIKTAWTEGNLEFRDNSGNIICVFKSATRELEFPSGALLDLSAATGLVTFAAGEILAADLGDAILTGLKAAVVADVNIAGGIALVHRVLVPSGANGDVDVVLTHKSRVLDAWVVMKGAGTVGSTLTVKNLATAITDALSVAASGDKAIVKFTTIDDAQHEIAAAGTLRVSKASTGGDFPGAEVYVSAIRVA